MEYGRKRYQNMTGEKKRIQKSKKNQHLNIFIFFSLRGI